MEAAGQGMSMNSFLLVFLLVMIVWVIFSMRGQKKKDEARNKEITALAKGDKVVIFGGIVGTVDGFKNEFIEIKVSENNKLTVLPTGIMHILPKPGAAAEVKNAK